MSSFLFVFLHIFAVSIYAQTDFFAPAEKIAAANIASTLVISGIMDDGRTVQSSGCCVASSGFVLTTAHQVEGVNRLTGRLPDGSQVELSVVDIDTKTEMVLLRSNRVLSASVVLGNADSLVPGTPLLSIATPQNLDFSTVRGIVSSKSRTYHDYPVIQAEMNASPGSSGGPVFGPDGRLVALIVGKLDGQPWFTVLAPVNNAFALLERNGLRQSVAESREEELIPAANISETERRALAAYNQGVSIATPGEKASLYALAVKLLPEFYEAWFNLGIAHTNAGDLEKASAAYQCAIAIRPTALESFRNLGRIQLLMKQPGDAVVSFGKAAQLLPEDARSYNDLGEALRQAKRLDEASQAFDRVLRLKPEYASAAFNLGLVFTEQGKTEEASRAFEQYLRLRPDAPDSKLVREWINQLSAKSSETKRHD